MIQISFNNTDMGYDGKAVVKDVSFTVSQGDYLVIVGENGAGKSTLIKTLLGILKPLKGTVEKGPETGHIGYLPQQTELQRDFPALAGEIVLSGCINRLGHMPFFSRRERSLAEEQMERLGIGPLAKKSFRELSGGQQQRVLLARALCGAGNILLLDEPVTGLDPKVSQELYELIQNLNRKSGLTVMMVSHDIQSVKSHATHVLHLSSGRNHFYGTREEYLESPMGRIFLTQEGGMAGE